MKNFLFTTVALQIILLLSQCENKENGNSLKEVIVSGRVYNRISKKIAIKESIYIETRYTSGTGTLATNIPIQKKYVYSDKNGFFSVKIKYLDTTDKVMLVANDSEAKEIPVIFFINKNLYTLYK